MDPPLTAQPPAGAEFTWRGPLAPMQPNLQGILGPEPQPVMWGGAQRTRPSEGGASHKRSAPHVLSGCRQLEPGVKHHPLVCEQRPTTSQERGLEQKGRNRQGRPFLPGQSGREDL